MMAVKTRRVSFGTSSACDFAVFELEKVGGESYIAH